MAPQPKLSIVGSVQPECEACGYEPCVCSYIVKLEPGGEMHHLASVALDQMDEPQPHRGGCPCPFCYSTRLKTFRRQPA